MLNKNQNKSHVIFLNLHWFWCQKKASVDEIVVEYRITAPLKDKKLFTLKFNFFK